MPKLRALEIYHSQITEQGLASLAACKGLESVQIKSSVPVSREAVARLQKELPNLRTVGISRPVSPVMPQLAQSGSVAVTR
jgi:hypothetical protein